MELATFSQSKRNFGRKKTYGAIQTEMSKFSTFHIHQTLFLAQKFTYAKQGMNDIKQLHAEPFFEIWLKAFRR